MFWSCNLSLHGKVDQCLNIITKLYLNFCGTVLKCKLVLVDGWFLVQHKARFTAQSLHLIDKSADAFSNNLFVTPNRPCHVKDLKKGHINSCGKAANLKTKVSFLMTGQSLAETLLNFFIFMNSYLAIKKEQAHLRKQTRPLVPH